MRFIAFIWFSNLTIHFRHLGSILVGSVCVSNIGNADSDSPSAMIQLKYGCLYHTSQERHCVSPMRLLYSTVSLCVVTLVCQWIVRVKQYHLFEHNSLFSSPLKYSVCVDYRQLLLISFMTQHLFCRHRSKVYFQVPLVTTASVSVNSMMITPTGVATRYYTRFPLLPKLMAWNLSGLALI